MNTKIKTFTFFIKESTDFDKDLFLEFEELGYNISSQDVYAKDRDSAIDGDFYHKSGEYPTEMKLKMFHIIKKGVGSLHSFTGYTLQNYLNELKELTQTLEIIENRLDSEIVILSNPNFELYLIDKVESIDNSKIINNLRQIKEYIEKNLNKSYYSTIELSEDGLTIEILDIHNDNAKIQALFRTKKFKQLNDTSKKIIFVKKHYVVPSDNGHHATLHYKLISRIKTEYDLD